MADGMGCKCNASCYGECCCEGVDWRSAREVKLEADNAALREQLAEAQKRLDALIDGEELFEPNWSTCNEA